MSDIALILTASPPTPNIADTLRVRGKMTLCGSRVGQLPVKGNHINYTVVGDTVNTAQRLEALGKEVDPDAEVTILISSTTRAQLPVGFKSAAVGSHLVKGKLERIDVYQLL